MSGSGRSAGASGPADASTEETVPVPTTRGFVPTRWAPVLFGGLLSLLMVVIVTGITTLRTTGPDADMPRLWLSAVLVSWPVAFPTVLVVAPLVRRVVARLVVHGEPGPAASSTAVGADRPSTGAAAA